MKRYLTRNPLRWFLLLWVGLVVTGALLGTSGIQTAILGSGTFIVSYSPGSQGPVTETTLTQQGQGEGVPSPTGVTLQSGLQLTPLPPLHSILLLLLFATLYGLLIWGGLSGQNMPRHLWLFLLLQGILILAIHLLMRQTNLTLNLCLASTLCALATLKRVGPVLLATAGYLLLFLFSTIITLPHASPVSQWQTLWINIWSFSDSMTMILFVVGYLILYAQQSRTQSQLEQAHVELQTAHARLTASSKRIETLTLLTERQRMARELHDTLAQGLAGMIMQLEVAYTHLVRSHYEQAQQILKQTLGSARATLVDARHAITDLRSKTSYSDQLLEEVQQELQHFLLTTGIRCQTTLQDLARVPPQLCETVLRFVREGLSNVARHARASQASVEVVVKDDWLEITIQDNGCGFDPRRQEVGHYGLLGLHERARLVQGTLSIMSSSGQGTTLSCRLPLVASSEDRQPTSPFPAHRRVESYA